MQKDELDVEVSGCRDVVWPNPDPNPNSDPNRTPNLEPNIMLIGVREW